MSTTTAAANASGGLWEKTRDALFNVDRLRRMRRAVVALIIFLVIWEVGARSEQLLGFRLWWLGQIPAPTSVAHAWLPLLSDTGYWLSWYESIRRVMTGFIVAQLVGIPLGLAMATSRVFYYMAFPVFEILRPIPPLAWVPASIIFWPTQESSIAFVTFLGAFFIVVINVVGGARSIDIRYFQSAYSMGSSKVDIFRRVILPGVLPSIVTGAAVGMGITWEVVVAAEMISGGGGHSAAGGGLGFFIWLSYIGGAYPQIVVGMISIGIAGYISSALIRKLGVRLTPWLRSR